MAPALSAASVCIVNFHLQMNTDGICVHLCFSSQPRTLAAARDSPYTGGAARPAARGVRRCPVIWLEFLLCAALLVLAAGVLSRYGDVLAEKSGLGRMWVGALLLASVTSLPELVSGITAVTWLNQPNLAAGGVLGSCLFNLGLIALLDLAYQPGSILARAQEGHILSGALSIVLLAAVASAVFLGNELNALGFFGVSLVSLAVLVVYALGAQLIGRFEQKRLAQVLEREAEVRQYDQISKPRAYAIFGLAALAVVGLGIWLATLGDRLAIETGLSRSFVGNLFLAVSTSLPEVASSLAAVRLGAIDLAISNVLGSNLFNVMLIALYDVADGGGNFWAALDASNGLAAVIAMMMTGIAIVSLVYRASPRTPYRLNWDGVAIGVLYVGAMVVLFRLA
jgi:cation:H+ antiporter